MQKTYNDFLNDLAFRESGGSYDKVNSIGYLGKYQMGELALIDTGYYLVDSRNDNTFLDKNWTGKDGVHSKTDFLKKPQAQENAIREYMAINWKYIMSNGIDRFVGKVQKGILLTVSGLLAGAHLGGIRRLRNFVKHGIIETDKNKVAITEYIQKFSDYETPFQPRKKLTGIKKDKKGKTLMYQVDGLEWLSKKDAIHSVKNAELDAVLVKNGVGKVFLRTPPDHSLSNNLIKVKM